MRLAGRVLYSMQYCIACMLHNHDRLYNTPCNMLNDMFYRTILLPQSSSTGRSPASNGHMLPTQPWPTALVAARQKWLKAAKGLAMAAWFMVRCGVMAARRHAKSLQQRLSSSVRVALFTPARGLETLKHRKEERGSDCSTFRKRAKNLPRIE